MMIMDKNSFVADMKHLLHLSQQGDHETLLKRLPHTLSSLIETLDVSPDNLVNSHNTYLAIRVSDLEKKNKLYADVIKELDERIRGLEKIINDAVDRKTKGA